MLRLAIAQFRPDKGDYAGNLGRLGALLREAAALEQPPELILLPESALTGYFLEGGVRELALTGEQLFEDLTRIHRESGAPPLDLSLGFYEVWRNRLHNSAMYATLGGPEAGIHHIHRKVFLPTYGVFDEERFVEPGRSIAAFDTRWGRAAMLVCEDAWHSLVPTLAALDGAQLMLIPSATPARGIAPGQGDGRPSNLDRWDRLAQAISEEHGVFTAVAHLVGFEGGKGFVGGSVITGPKGDVRAQGPLFEQALITTTLDFNDITRARAEQPLLSDLEIRFPHLLEGHFGRADGQAGSGNGVTTKPRQSGTGRIAGSPPASPPARLPAGGDAGAAGDLLAIDPDLTRRWLVEFIRDEFQRRRGFEKAVIGLSGGVDSALVAFLAAEALGKENVTAVRMPYRTSSPDSLAHAQLVIDHLGVQARTVDISVAVDALVTAIGGNPDGARKGNIMARMRMITLFDLSAELRALPLGTGNKTERLLGYFTWHADDSPPVNPLGDLFKTQVWALARAVGVPDVIVSKPASADLIQGQTDEGDFGISYARADQILHWLLSGYDAAAIAAHGFTPAEVALVSQRLESTHWKRRLPTVAMLSQTAIGEYYLRPVDY
ncbi:MAG TPA: NAD+ synthase [Gemmatimonadales bacterium]|nr:NAD+ synthase [Gemmatimonadales bacterium]